MKNLVIIILLIAAVATGGLYLQERQHTAAANASVASLRQELDDLQQKLAEQEKRTATVQNRLQDTREAALAKAGEVQEMAQALTNQAKAVAAPTNARPSSPLAGMMKDPEMKDMIVSQQKAAFDRGFKKTYGKEFADLGLTQQQSDAMKDLLLKKQTAGMDAGMQMVSEDLDPAKRTELFQQVKADRAAVDSQIKQLLGDDTYAQFDTWEKAAPDRGAVSGFKNQLSGGDTALNNDQESQLLAAMTQERQNFKFTTDYSDQNAFNGDFATYFTDERLNQYFQEQGQLNQQYLMRAQGILSADQLDAYQKYLATQQDQQKMALKMAAKMFAPKSGGN